MLDVKKSLSREELEAIVHSILKDGSRILNREKAMAALQRAGYDNPEHEFARIEEEFLTPSNVLAAEQNLALAARDRVAAIEICVANERRGQIHQHVLAPH